MEIDCSGRRVRLHEKIARVPIITNIENRTSGFHAIALTLPKSYIFPLEDWHMEYLRYKKGYGHSHLNLHALVAK